MELRSLVASLDRPIARIENAATARRVIHGQFGHFLGAFTPNGAALDVAFVYGPFGEILAESGTDTADYTQRFNGKEQDALTSLSYYGARYFDPLSLTWTQADPLYRFAPDAAWDQPRRANLYSFSLNNPVRYVDPDGLCPGFVECLGAGVAAAGGGAAAIATVALVGSAALVAGAIVVETEYPELSPGGACQSRSFASCMNDGPVADVRPRATVERESSPRPYERPGAGNRAPSESASRGRRAAGET